MEQPTIEQNNTPTIGLQELTALAQIVAIASQRGTFRAEELSSVGAVYDRLTAFLAANMPAEPATTESAEASTENNTGE